MDLLSGSDSDSADKKGQDFTINKKYAKSYAQWRRKEEKQKLIDKYGEDVLDSDSESEDEIRSTKTLDKEWLRAYAVVRFQQPRLYSGEKLFKEEVKPVPKKVEKKTTLKDHERKFVLEKGGLASEDEDEEFVKHTPGPSYFEEQEEIKSSLKKAIGQIDDDADDDEEDDSLLVKKTKTEEEQKEEENDYLAWLKGEKEELEDQQASEELAPLKALWSDPNLTDKERTLRDYILNNGYMDKEGSDSEDEDGGSDMDSSDFDEEEKFLDQADAYEKTYNFRHEEPGGIEIKTYPRNIESSVRAKEENRRVEKRRLKAEKKKREQEQRMEEVRLLQRMQREEKEEKLQKLKDLAENQQLEYNLDEDFDPQEHEKIMKKYFDDTYYGEEAAGEKPVFEENDEIEGVNYEDEAEDWWQKRKQDQAEEIDEGEEEIYADDPNFVMDADYDPSSANTTKKSKKERKQSKKEVKKAKKKKKLEKAPLFDPTTKTFDEYLEEYLKDKINKLPFTYREVIPIDFGLSTDEILSAKDKELNAWVSVKKMSMYRSKEEEKSDMHKYRAKSQNTHKKHKTMPSLAPQTTVAEERDIPALKKKKNKKKKKDKLKEQENTEGATEATEETQLASESCMSEEPESGKKKKKKRALESEDCDGLESEPKKKKQKVLKNNGDKMDENTSLTSKTVDEASPSPQKVAKKKKKRSLESDNTSFDDQDSAVLPPKKKTRIVKNSDNNTNETSLVDDSSSSPQKVKKKKKKEEKANETSSENDVLSNKSELLNGECGNNVEEKKQKQSSTVQQPNALGNVGNKVSKKQKKSKLKLVDASEETEEHRPLIADKAKAKKNVKKFMSSARLSSYGIGHGAHKHGNKLGNKKKKKSSG